jgi:hypothetical protein
VTLFCYLWETFSNRVESRKVARGVNLIAKLFIVDNFISSFSHLTGKIDKEKLKKFMIFQFPQRRLNLYNFFFKTEKKIWKISNSLEQCNFFKSSPVGKNKF